MPKQHRVNFEELKARADFRAVLLHYGLSPMGAGEQARILCPFHDDERPSCSVNLAKGLFHCFACEAKGNVLDFVHRLETKDGAVVSLRAAGLKLASICGLSVGHGHAPQTRHKARSAANGAKTASTPSRDPNGAPGAPGAPGEGAPEAPRPARNKPLGFRLTLDPAHPYLAERNIPRELVALFGLGHCAQGSMAGRVCVPIANARGELVAYAGRWAGSVDLLPEGEEKWKLPKGFHKSLELFNLHRVKPCRHLIVVEGFFDAVRLHGLRLPAVALMGTAISEEQVALLREHAPELRALTVLLDGDAPGRKAADSVAARLARHWWVRIAELPEGEEPDTAAPEMLNELVRRARS